MAAAKISDSYSVLIQLKYFRLPSDFFLRSNKEAPRREKIIEKTAHFLVLLLQ